MSQSQAQKRLLVEYRNLTNDPPDGITAGPTTEDDMFIWEALIEGPVGTPFEGGVFPAEMKFPKDYPLSPPSMRFLCEVWHPNGECRFLLWDLGRGGRGGKGRGGEMGKGRNRVEWEEMGSWERIIHEGEAGHHQGEAYS